MFTIRTTRAQKCFEAVCLAYIDDFSRDWIDQSPKACRPVLFKFACSSAIYKPFTANVALGEPISRDGYKPLPFEFPRRAGHKLYTQELGEVTVGTYLLEEPFEIEPRNPFHEDVAPKQDADKKKGEDGEDAEEAPPPPRDVRFCMMPSQADLEANTADLDVAAIMSHVLHMSKTLPVDMKSPMLKYLPAYSMLWAGYVDRRINAPIIQEPEFIAQAFVAAANAGTVKWFEPHGVTALGYATPWYCRTHESTLRTILAQEIKLYQQIKGYAARASLPEGLL